MARNCLWAALLLAAVLLSVFGYSGCDFGSVKDPEDGGANSGNSKCPQIPESGPYASLEIEGLDLSDQKPPKELKDKEGFVIGRVGADLSHAKEGYIQIKYDFGTMEAGATRSHVFKVTNAGDGKLELVKNRSSCQCTIAGVKKGGLAKGDSTEIKLEWTAKTGPEFSQSVEICTNDPKHKMLEIQVSGQVTSSIEIRPEGTWNVGDVEGDKSGKIDGWIGSRSRSDLKIELEYDKQVMELEFTKETDEELKQHSGDGLRPRSGYRVKGKLKPSNKIGPFKYTVTVKSNVDKLAKFKIPVVGLRKGPISIRAHTGVRQFYRNSLIADLGQVSARKGATGYVVLFVKGLEGKELELKSSKSKPAFIQTKLQPFGRSSKAGSKTKSGAAPSKVAKVKSKSYLLKLTIPPYSKNLPLDAYTITSPAKVVLETNHPNAKSITLGLVFEPIEDR